MKSYRRLGWSKPRVIAWLMTLGVALCFGATAQAAPQYDLDCAACHTMPPLDSVSGLRVPATGATKGNHQSHADATAVSCSKCHGPGALSYPTGHRSKSIEVSGNINGSATGSYSRGFFNQTSIPPAPLGTCSNVNCHFERITPTWGSPLLVNVTDCNQCHGASPSAGHPTGGSKHGIYYGTGTASCLKCHPDHTAEAKPFAHATSVTSRGISVRFTAAPNSGGSYSGPTNDFLPSQSNSFGTCSGIYCHSDGTSLNGPYTVNTAPSWGGATLGCNGCHGGPASLGSPIATGKHQAHINNAATLGSNYGCADCHAKTASGDAAISTVANHVNTFLDYSGVRAGRSSTYSAGSCSAAYCHTSGKKGKAGMVGSIEPGAPSWSGAALGCNGCHGAQSTPTAGVAFNAVAGEPNYTSGAAGAANANSHQKHVAAAGASTCANCHSKTTTTGTALIAGSQHTDGFINYTAGNGKSFGRGAGKTCSNVSCHGGNGIVAAVADAQWGATLNCNGCHGGPAALGTNILVSGKHGQHTDQAGVIGDNLGCADCHAKTVSSNTTVSDSAKHLNAFLDYSGVRAGRSTTLSAGTCSASYCHSSGKKGQSGMVATVEPANPSWSGAALGCNGCHGAQVTPTAGVLFNSVAGEPNYTSGAAGAANANSHQKHAAAGASTCANCHSKTTTNGTSIIAGSQHLNLLANYTSGNGKVFGKVAGKSCSNISCHSGNGIVAGVGNAQWGATLDCNGCHGGPAALGSNILASGKHGAHANQAALLGDNLGCADCHSKTVSSNTLVSDATKHLNTFVDYSGVKAGRSTTYSGGNCSATYCHTSGKKGQSGMVATVEPAVPSWSGAALGCNGCHGAQSTPTAGVAFNSVAGEPNYASGAAGSASANSHLKHVGVAGAATCANCHSKTTTNGSSLIVGNQHLNLLANYTSGNGKVFGKVAGKSCSNVSCHGGNGVVTSIATAQWGATLDCNGCHGGPLALGTNILASGKHTQHTNQAGVIGDNLGCAECHAKTVSSNSTVSDSTKHMNSFADYSGVRAGNSATLVGGSCSATYCHSSGKKGQSGMVSTVEPAAPSWSGAALGCTGCHGAKLTPTAGVAFNSVAGEPNYVNGGAGAENANSHQKHVGAAGAATCANCHSKTTTTGSAVIAGSQHLNALNNYTSGNGKTFAKLANKTCSNISCHSGNGMIAGVANAQWGATLDCNGCHGGPTALGSNILNSGKHAAHMNNAALLGANYGCVECHSKTVSSDSAISDTVKHGNAFADYSGVKAGRSSTYSGGTCSATYCHTSGKKGQSGMVATVEPANPSWSGAALGCKGCHGAQSTPTAGVAFNSGAGEPNYVNGGSGANNANSHQKHVKTDGAITCVRCHSGTVDAAGTALIGNHTNKSVEVVNGGGETFGYPGSKTCSNVSCHNSGYFTSANAIWGSTLDCKGCHATLSSGHTRHIGTAWNTLPFYNYTANASTGADTDGVTWKNYSFGCANCHPVTTASHMNGSLEVENGQVAGGSVLRNKNTASALVGTIGTGTVRCSNVYCHFNVTTPQWNQTFTVATRCGGCHGNAPTSDSHAAHAVGIHYDNIFSGTSGLLASSGAVGVNAGHGDPAQSTTIGCNICHYNTVTNARNKYNSSCSTASCHGNTTGSNADATGAARIANLAFHVNGSNNVVFAPSTIIKSKAQIALPAFNSYTAGLAGWSSTSRVYKNGTASAYDRSKNNLTVGSYAGGSCSNISCHNGVSANWVTDFGSARDCVMCHSN